MAQDRAGGGEWLVFLSLAGRAGPTALGSDHLLLKASQEQRSAQLSNLGL